MKLSKIIKGIDLCHDFSLKDIEISDVCIDSRKCTKGSLFVAVKGYDVDGHNFISQAIKNGASAILFENKSFEEEISTCGILHLQCKDSRVAVNIAANNYYNRPSEKIKLIGVTGTNGKTTIATLLYDLFRSLGYGVGLLSTIANYVDGEKYPTINTTPDPISIFSLINEMVNKGCEYCFMEVSSHSLHQGRIAGLNFTGAIFTNLTHDHLDYHKTFSEYIRCKKLLFDNLPKGSFAITNIDDKNGEVVVQNTKANIYSYSSMRDADYNVKIIEKSIDGSMMNIDGVDVWTRFIGEHNAHNLIAVYAAARKLGADKDELLKALSNLKPVSGRLEYISGYNGITAVIDYAHTPDALENVLKTLNDISNGRQICVVFGCGGNRDKTKRPEMGEIAVRLANRVIVTSDNPRFEDPNKILKDIKQGIQLKDRVKTLFIVDREEAIKTAIVTAAKDAIVLLAGKGHEDYQIINGVKSHFSDKEIVRNIFNEIK